MAEQTRTVALPIDSRYKDTAKLFDSSGRIYFDLWEEPQEIAADRDSTLQHVPIDSDVGRLDLLSHAFYRNTVPWWAIAAANGIRDQVEDVQDVVEQDVRKALVIPRSVAVQAFLTRR